MCEDDRDVRVADEGHLARQALEEEAPEGVDVGPRIDRIAAHLLGCDVRERAEQALRDVDRLEVACRRRDAEVRQVTVLPSLLLVDQHVARLDVAVDESSCVRGVERRGDLGGERDRPRRLEAPVAPQHGAEVAALDQPHGDVDVPVRLAGRIDRDHVGMVDAGGQLRLAQDALARGLVVHESRREHLERHGARQVLVDRAKHLPHAPPPEQALEGVTGDLVARAEV